MKVQCCKCKRFCHDDNEWRGDDPQPESDEPISHGYCPPCAKEAFAELKEEIRQIQEKKLRTS